MKGKLALVAGFAAGYVLGARAGRNRYQQIRRLANNVWEAESVQAGVGYVSDFAEARVEDARDFVADKVSAALSSAGVKGSKKSSNSSASSDNS